MSELINEIVGEEAFKQVKKLDDALTDLVKKFEANSKAAIFLEQSLSNSSTINETTTNIKKVSAASTQLESDLKKVQAAEERLRFAQSEYGKQVAATNVEIQAQGTANKNAAREAKAAEDSVNRMSAQLIKLRTQYDMLSKAQREAAKGKDLLLNIQSLDIELKGIDGTLGRFGRNVGNYGMISKQLESHLNTLTTKFRGLDASMRASPMGMEMERNIKSTTNAIQLLNANMQPAQNGARGYQNQLFGLTQVLREMPAFTYSAQTGILGISNNLPILADNFKSVKNAVNETTGKINGTVGALKIFGASIFSFGNVFAIAIGLFTIFSKQIFEAFKGVKSLTDAKKELNTAIDEGNKNALKEISTLDVLYKTTQNTNLSIEQRKKAVDKLQELYPSYFANIEDEIILNGGAKKSYNELRDAIFASARARAIHDKLEERASARLDKELELRKNIDMYNQRAENATATETVSSTSRLDLGVPEVIRKSKEQNRQLALFQKDEAIKRLEIFKQASLKEDDDLLQAEQEYYNKSAKLEADRVKAKTTKIGGASKDPKVKPIIDPKLSDTDLEDLKKYYAAIKDQFVKTMGEWVDDPESNKAFEEYLGSVVNQKDPISDADAEDLSKAIFKKINDNADAIQLKIDKEKALKEAEELLAEINQMVGMATSAMADITGIQYDREIAAIDKRNKALSESYDAEKKMIDGKYTNQADKTKALAELDAKHEAQQKQIDRDRISADRKRAQQEKAYNIANIITSTALAVIKAYTEGDPYTKIPRAILAGAAGAASLARAIAAPLPQYADGTDNHKGGLAIVGERGTELGVLPSGKTFLTDAVPTIMDLPKGTQIIPHEKLMAQVYNLAFKKLGDGNKVTSDSMQIAMIESFENKLKELIQETKRSKSNTSVNINGNFDHYMHVQKNIR